MERGFRLVLKTLLLSFLAQFTIAQSVCAQALTVSVNGGDMVVIPAGGIIGTAGPGLTLKLVDVTDVRCPSDLDCYWEGLIRAVFLVNGDAPDAQSIVLCNMCEDGTREAVVAGYRLTLDRLEPEVVVIEALGRGAVLADYNLVVTIAAAP